MVSALTHQENLPPFRHEDRRPHDVRNSSGYGGDRDGYRGRDSGYRDRTDQGRDRRRHH